VRGRRNPDYGASEGYHLGAYDSLVMESMIYGKQSRSGELESDYEILRSMHFNVSVFSFSDFYM
jgi:hypothetical protein